MLRTMLLSALCASAVAFNGPAMRAPSTASAVSMMAKKKAAAPEPAAVELSKCIPFVAKPEGLNGELLLDIGFDPAGFTNKQSYEQLVRLREVELKHGRVSMLAVVGFIVQEFVCPYQKAPFDVANQFDAFGVVPALGLVQILGFCGYIELNAKVAEPRIPGDIGFDPLALSRQGIKEDYAIAELKHGRLAMIGFAGMCAQIAVTGKPVLQTTFEVFSP